MSKKFGSKKLWALNKFLGLKKCRQKKNWVKIYFWTTTTNYGLTKSWGQKNIFREKKNLSGKNILVRKFLVQQISMKFDTEDPSLLYPFVYSAEKRVQAGHSWCSFAVLYCQSRVWNYKIIFYKNCLLFL